jgi:SEC-C motif domain protein
MSYKPSIRCYCGSAKPFGDCCEPLHNGAAQANSAEQLMRSRYSAFCCANINYLMSTLHPSRHQQNDRESLKNTAEHCRWIQLTIKHTLKGLNVDQTGEVEFVAVFHQDGNLDQLHERSRFVKENDQWFYLDGDIFEHKRPIVLSLGRNDSCWCGSGKKFKKCHG